MAWTFISRVFLLCRFHFHPPNDRARVAALEGEVGRMQPNLRADKQYADVSRRLKEADARLRGARAGSGRAASAFARTKKRRYRKFMGMYAHVERRIDAVYKELTRSRTHPMGGTAYLALDNLDEPYLGGIKYTAMPPTKRFRDMQHLSGGEKTVARRRFRGTPDCNESALRLHSYGLDSSLSLRVLQNFDRTCAS